MCVCSFALYKWKTYVLIHQFSLFIKWYHIIVWPHDAISKAPTMLAMGVLVNDQFDVLFFS